MRVQPDRRSLARATSLRILGKTWRVIRKPIECDACLHYGRTDHIAGTIQINTACPPDQQFDTVLHECIHVLDNELKLGLSEATVSRLASGLAGLALDNPALFRPGRQANKGD